MGGGNFFKIDRAIFDHSIWQDPVQFRIFFYLVGKAVWSEDGLMKGDVHIPRGHWLMSYRRLRDELEYLENNAVKKYPLSRIHRAIEKLEAAEMIKKHETELGTLFEVVNYAKYQGFQGPEEEARNTPRNEDGTQMERRWNNNKKDKKDKKDKNIQQQQGLEASLSWVPVYEMNYGMPSMTVIQIMNSYLDDGLEHELLILAIEKAAENGQPFHYAKGILNKWIGKKILTVAAAMDEEEEFNKRKVERIHGKNRPQQNSKPKPKYGTDRSKLDFTRARGSL